MRSGRLKDRVTIKYRSDTTDEYGEQVDNYVEVFSAKCDFKLMTGIESIKAGLTLNVEVATVLMRLDERLLYEHYMVFNDNRFEVVSIKPDKNKREMIVTVKREVA